MERKELFISYRREASTLQFIGRLIHDLEQNGFSVWLDTRDILPGGDWHGSIGIGLTQCAAIIPVMTKEYLTSRHCVNELYTADGDRKHIFPIFLEDIDLNASEAGQGVKYVVSSVNWTMCRPGVDDYNKSFSRLVNAMKQKGLGTGGSVQENTGTPASTPSCNPPTATPTPKVGPTCNKPFKVIRDVEILEGITTSKEGHLIVSCMSGQKVIIFNHKHEKVAEIGGEPGLGMGHFLCPSGVAVDKDGNVLVAGHYFIQKFTINGDFLQQAGGTDPKGFQIDSPKGMTISKSGRIYIAEQKKNRITVLNPDLSFYKTFSDGDPLLGSGHLSMPQGIVISSLGSVYVADMMNHAIQVFDEEGNFQFRFGKMGAGPGFITAPTAITIDSKDNIYVSAGSVVSIFDSKGSFLYSFGEYGSEVGKFNPIRALHLDQSGVLFVGELSTNRIQLFNTLEEDVTTREELKRQSQSNSVPPSAPSSDQCHVAASPVAQATSALPTLENSSKHSDSVSFCTAATNISSSTQKGYLRCIDDIDKVGSIAVSKSGCIVISSGSLGKLSIYNDNCDLLNDKVIQGLDICVITISDDDIIIAASVCKICKLNMELNEVMSVKGSNVKDWTYPYGIALGTKGRLYVAAVDSAIILNDDLTHYKVFAKKTQSFSIAVDSSGRVYRPVLTINTIQVFSSEGEPLFQFGDPGLSPVPQFSLLSPLSIAIDHNDNVYVGVGMISLNVFSKEGKFISVLTSSGTKLGQLSDVPVALCIDNRHHILYFAEHSTKKVQIFKLM